MCGIINEIYNNVFTNRCLGGDRMKKILFVCTGNTCRSPMAEGLFNRFAEKNNIDAAATSAGIFVTERRINKNSIDAMKDFGIDISSHIPMQLEDYTMSEADFIITMTSSHKSYLISNGFPSAKIFTLAEFAGSSGDISDPYGLDLDVYRKTAEEIDKLIKQIKL